MEPSTRRGRARSTQPIGEGRSLFARIAKKDPRDERRSRRTETKDFQHKLENIPNLDISMGDVPTRPRRAGASTATTNGSAATTRPAPGSLVELKVTNWEKNKAASTSNDGGLESLIQWLEKKGTAKLKNRSRQLKIKKVCCGNGRYPRCFDHRKMLYSQLAAASGPLSFAANLRTTTAIQDLFGLCLSYG